MGYGFVCNKLYEYLLPDDLKEEILFLTDDELRAPERFDFSSARAFIGQPFFMRKPLMDHMPALEWLGGTGAGYDAADCDEIKRRGITLTNSRGVMSRSIAEDVMLKMLFFSRKAREVEQNKRDRKWNSFGQDQWMCRCYCDLFGKTLGILGYGSIGHETAVRAHAFGMRIIAYGRTAKDADLIDEYYTDVEDIDTVLAKSDFVSVNLPLLPSTRHIIDDRAFALMKPTAMLINVARGPIVDGDALYRALKSGTIAWAACDVFEKEPLPCDSPLWELDNIFITSHKAGMGDTWTYFIGRLIESNIRRFKAGETLENVIKL